MAQVPSTSVVTYFGFTFPVESKVTIAARYQYDKAERTVTCAVYTVTVRALLAPTADDGTTGEQNLASIRQTLASPGRSLVISGTGFGDLSVNDIRVNTKRDVLWGPRPKTLTWEPLGNNAANIVWQCEVAIPECSGAVYQKQLMTFNYSSSVIIDEQGYASRTLSGHLEIPETRDEGGRSLTDVAEDYWLGVYPAIPRGFRRTRNERLLDESKRRLNFTVTDSEMAANVFPPDVVECRASYRVQSQSRTLLTYMAQLSASYVLRKGVDKAESYLHFLALAKSIIEAQQKAAKAGSVKVAGILPLSFSAGNPDIYGRGAGEFTFAWTFIVRPSTLGTLLKGAFSDLMTNFIALSALWPTPKPTDYTAWRASVSGVMGPGGTVGLATAGVNDDQIVDLCSNVGALTPGNSFFTVPFPPAAGIGLLIPAPNGIGSYLRTDVRLRTQTRTNIVVQRLVGAVDDIQNWANATFDQMVYGVGPGAAIAEWQRRGHPHIIVFLMFDLIRAGVPPPPPKLTSYGGSTTNFALLDSTTANEQAANFGVILYRLRGALAYSVNATGEDIPKYPPSVELGTGEKAFAGPDGTIHFDL